MLQSLFGVVVPGRPLVTEWAALSESKCVTALIEPASVNEITFFLLPSTPIPPGYGAVLYYTTPPGTDWSILGAVTPMKPSGIFRTGWTTMEEMQFCPAVQLGVSLEPFETIDNLQISGSGVDDRFAFAHKIARDLFLYMTSFSTPTNVGEMLMVPTGILDRWIERFNRKYSIDPNFMMKDMD